MEKNEKLLDRVVNWMRYSISLKLVIIGILSLLLLLPLKLIERLIFERKFRQIKMVEEVNQKWGREVFVYGPILKVPYRSYTEVQKTNPKTEEIVVEKHESIQFLFLFPDELHINGEITPYSKKRGIYQSVVFTEESDLSGIFKINPSEIKGIQADDILWESTRIILKTSNLKGIINNAYSKLNNINYEFHPNFSNEKDYHIESDNRGIILKSLESDYLLLNNTSLENGISFNIKLDFNGSEKIRYVPVGRTTTANLKSSWKSPSFIGNFLPLNEGKVHEDGFDAKWKILNVNRGFGQMHFHTLPNLLSYGFGVSLIIPVDQYLQIERSTKYGYLIIVLTFLVFFLIQIISKINMHVFQYILIGLALVIFYTLLLSISEHTQFMLSYLISSLSIIILITLYSKSILNQSKFSILVGSSLMALYAFIFVIIQLENYSLLVGSIGLFAILATIMYFTRKIEWKLNPE